MDRGVTFSPAMVQAMLAGRKTQTRRLASSPLRRCQPGDRLYVREHWKTHGMLDDIAPSDIPKHVDMALLPLLYLADATAHNELVAGQSVDWTKARHRQAMHMPRWASRMTLLIDEVRTEPVQLISDDDAQAEGVVWVDPTDDDRKWAVANAEEYGGSPDIEGVWSVPGLQDAGCDVWHNTAPLCYGRLWDMLHPEPPHRFADNPLAVALTFRVIHQNIDRIEP